MPSAPDLSLTVATTLLAIWRAEVFSTFACGRMGARVAVNGRVGWVYVSGAALDELVAAGLVELPADDDLIEVTAAGHAAVIARGWATTEGERVRLADAGAYWLRRRVAETHRLLRAQG